MTVTFPANALRDTDGNESVASVESFTAAGPKISLLTASVDVTQLNALGYIDFYVEGSSGGAISPASLTDAEPEFIVSGAAAQ
ncbi:MAG: hypothetical protein ACKPHU_14625, partial [Planctomycetaceae bacterium]